MHITIDSAIIVHKRRKILSIVEEVEAVIATGHMCNQLAMQCVIGRGSHTVLGHNLLRAQTVVVVLELDRRTVLAHLAQLSASASGVAPDTIIQRIADSVIGDALTVVRSQFILPVGITIAIRNGFQCSADSSRGIGILHLYWLSRSMCLMKSF